MENQKTLITYAKIKALRTREGSSINDKDVQSAIWLLPSEDYFLSKLCDAKEQVNMEIDKFEKTKVTRSEWCLILWFSRKLDIISEPSGD